MEETVVQPVEHTHPIVDDDPHFIINPDTREITHASPEKLVLIQGDHMSERYTFELPKTIDGHDMSLCNEVQVHFINVDAINSDKTSASANGVSDFGLKVEDDEAITFSWLIPQSATTYAGSLSFAVRFICRDENGKVQYVWNTAPFSTVTVSTGIDNGEAVVDEFNNILEDWYNTLVHNGATSLEAIEEAKNKVVEEDIPAAKVKAIKEVDDHAETAAFEYVERVKESVPAEVLNIKNILVHERGYNPNKIMSQKGVSNALDSLETDYEGKVLEARNEIRSEFDEFKSKVEEDVVAGLDDLGAVVEWYKELTGRDGRTDIELGVYDLENATVSSNSGLNLIDYEYRILNFDTTKASPSKVWILFGGYDADDIYRAMDVELPLPEEYGKCITDFTIRFGDIAVYHTVDGRFLDVPEVLRLVYAVDGNIIDETLEIEGIEKIDLTTIKVIVENVESTGSVYAIPLDPSLQHKASVKLDPISVVDVRKTATNGLTDTYTISLSNGSTRTFELQNGNGINEIHLLNRGDYEDLYEIDFTNDTSTTFTVPNGGSVGIKRTATGEVVSVNDVSPIEHGVKVKVKNLPDGVEPTLMNVYVTDRNLISYPYHHTTETVSGIEFIDYGDGHLGIKGTATEYAAFYVDYGNLVFEDGVEYEIVLPKDPHIKMIIAYVDETGTSRWEGSRLEWKSGYTYKNIYIQVDKSFTVDEVYMPCIRTGPLTIAIPNHDGTVYGITSISPNMTIFTDTVGVTVEAEYNVLGVPESAYDTAVRLGFEGTEEEWIASLKGADGKDIEVVHTTGNSKTAVMSQAAVTGEFDKIVNRVPNCNLLDPANQESGYYSVDANMTPSASGNHYRTISPISIEGLSKLYITTDYPLNDAMRDDLFYVMWLDENGAFIRGTSRKFNYLVEGSIDEWNVVAGASQIHIWINKAYTGITFDHICISAEPIEEFVPYGTDPVIKSEVLPPELFEKSKCNFDNFYEYDMNSWDGVNVTPETKTYTAGAIWDKGQQVSTSSTTAYSALNETIEVIEGVTYKITNFCGIVSFTDADHKTGKQQNFISETADIDVVVPDGFCEMCIAIRNSMISDFGEVIRITPITDEEKESCKITMPRLSVESANAPMKGKTIVNFGDSIFGNYKAPTDISTFIAEKTGATVHNCGFGGCRMSTHSLPNYAPFSMFAVADAITSGDFTSQDAAVVATEGELVPSYFADHLALLKSIDFSKVDIITIGYGTNDFTSAKDLENADDPYDTSKFGGALRYSIEKILTAFPHIRIFICSQTYRFWMDDAGAFTEDSDTKVWSIGVKLPEYVARTKEIADEYHLPFIDNYNELGFNKFNRTVYFPANDGTHPNEAGRKVIANHIAHELF